jgi:hypothetical protein
VSQERQTAAQEGQAMTLAFYWLLAILILIPVPKGEKL